MSSHKTENIINDIKGPSWLNEQFFLKVIQKIESQNDVEIKQLRLVPASAKNDQYASEMYRAILKYTKGNQLQDISLILKTMPEEDGYKKEFLKDTKIFETEIGMYTEIIPMFEKILHAAGDYTKFGPKCLYHSLSPKKIIIFEDKIQHNYTVLSKRQTNLEETKAVYSKIAKWHAISYKLNLEQPELFKNYHSNVFVDLKLGENEFVKDGITNFIDMLNDHDDLIQYKKYFEPLDVKILDYVEATFKEYTDNRKPSAYYVLCHGDFHHRNMLFKYEKSTSKLLDVLLIDYQVCYIGPIVNDIINSIYMLIDAEQRLELLDEVLYFYFTVFQETLKKINFTGTMPKMIEFRKQLLDHRHFTLFYFTGTLPLLYATFSDEHDLADLLSSKEKRKVVFKNPKFVNEVRKLLPKYLHLGYLEN